MVERLIKIAEGMEPFSRRPKPICFFLDWETKKAEWRTIHTLPAKRDIKFSTVIQWKDCKNEIRICSNYHQPASIVLSEHFEDPYTNESYLKSHLQKCVRRSNSYKALKTAKHFIDMNLEGFLRRLAIIAVEDALPLEGYSILVWLIAATSKGYLISDSQICWCYGYLYSLCQCPYYEIPGKLDKLEFTRLKVHKLSEPGSDLVHSLYLRKAYGGMKNDKLMMTAATKLWFHRYLTESVYCDLLKRDTFYITPPDEPLRLDEWYLAGIDFHCAPYMVPNLAEKYELDDDLIREAIWYFSSSVTDKTDILDSGEIKGTRDMTAILAKKEHLKGVWAKIARSFFSNARYHLKTGSGI